MPPLRSAPNRPRIDEWASEFAPTHLSPIDLAEGRAILEEAGSLVGHVPSEVVSLLDALLVDGTDASARVLAELRTWLR